MRILLDECVNPRLRLAFPGSAVKTVAELGWRSFTNGRLLREAAGKFDLFVTLDQNLEFQNPARSLSLGILVLKTRFNDLATYRPQFAAIRDAAARTKPGQVTVLPIG
jgi:predicted nuclease of predicted toxin-antitoxin system